jgi:hypothetical protein
MFREICLFVFLSFVPQVLTFCSTLTHVARPNKLSTITCSDPDADSSRIQNGFCAYYNFEQGPSKKETLRLEATKLSATRNKIPLRRWNLNRKGSPFGFDRNAEVWNGRVAQVSEST